jgi:hypothetical protein
MADIFSRLAERTLGLAAVARPAIAPMFAPGPQIVTEPAEAIAPRPKPVVNREETEGRSERLPAREVQQDALPTVPKPSAVIAEMAAPAVSAEPVSSIARHDVSMATQVTNVDRIPPVRDAEVQASTIFPPFDGEVLPSSKEARQIDKPVPRVEPSESALARTIEVPSPMPETLPREHTPVASGRRTNIAEERAATSVVRVNIGRIEVRAVFSEAPSPAIASPALSSSLSLADYLNQRDGGTR